MLVLFESPAMPKIEAADSHPLVVPAGRDGGYRAMRITNNLLLTIQRRKKPQAKVAISSASVASSSSTYALPLILAILVFNLIISSLKIS